MQENLRMTPSVQKNICEYFNGDYQDSVYQYRSGSNLVEMYTTRFGTQILWLALPDGHCVMTR
jgi:hypothetical protein